MIKDDTYIHAVFNDIVDAMAKAETNDNPINRAENFNLVRVIPDAFRTFKEVEAGKQGIEKTIARRMHTRKMIEIILNDKNVKPLFDN